MLGVVGQQYIVRLHGALYEETWYCTEHFPLNAAQVVNFCLKFYNEVKTNKQTKSKTKKRTCHCGVFPFRLVLVCHSPSALRQDERGLLWFYFCASL